MQAAKFDTPYEAIFSPKCKFGKGNTPLYNTQKELALEIINNAKSGLSDKSEITIRSAISQIFTGERNLSEKLRIALFFAIERRFDKKKYNYEKFIEEITQKLRIIYTERLDEKRAMFPDRDYDTLIEWTKVGREFLITTLQPAETYNTELANRLKNELLEKTGIVPKSYDDIAPAKYKFYLPENENGKVARKFWDSLKKYAAHEYNIDSQEIEHRLKEANKAGDILTYLVPRQIAMHPYVFINYSNRQEVRGFCVSYRDENIPSVAELSSELVFAWIAEYTPQLPAFEENNEWKIY